MTHPVALGAPPATRPYAVEDAGVRLMVRLTPRARTSGPAGLGADADGRPVLLMRVAAPPVEGAANGALVACLAAGLGLRKADVTIRAGAAGRLKRLHLAGDPALIIATLDRWTRA